MATLLHDYKAHRLDIQHYTISIMVQPFVVNKVIPVPNHALAMMVF
jgi:hypothetical protein